MKELWKHEAMKCLTRGKDRGFNLAELFEARAASIIDTLEQSGFVIVSKEWFDRLVDENERRQQ